MLENYNRQKKSNYRQTGSNDNNELVLLGLALFPLSLIGMDQNKRKFLDKQF